MHLNGSQRFCLTTAQEKSFPEVMTIQMKALDGYTLIVVCVVSKQGSFSCKRHPRYDHCKLPINGTVVTEESLFSGNYFLYG